MKKIELTQMDNRLASLLHQAKKSEIVFVIDGKPAGYLHGFSGEDDWFEYKLFSDPRFIKRIEKERAAARAGHVYSSEEVDAILEADARAGCKRGMAAVVSEGAPAYGKHRPRIQTLKKASEAAQGK
ncbi:MAG TPA: hypothetical protein VKX17_15140 [Planctomycetota bacterium]|nr:hypothetical protein [Planctomycetota bacterium]